MARRTKGEGTLRKRKDGRWEGWFNIGKDENGKTKRKSSDAPRDGNDFPKRSPVRLFECT